MRTKRIAGTGKGILTLRSRERERERDGKDRLRVDSKRKSRGEVTDTLFSEGG
jgi:hypothetical protein